MTIESQEIGKTIIAAGMLTNYHDVGAGDPVILIHGSGPGVSAWANWRLNIASLADHRRVLAPDMAGFGYTERVSGQTYDKKLWIRHLLEFMDALKIPTADLVGNSFGGGLALAFAMSYPDRVRRLVLMGSVGVNFELTEGLEAVWGYKPSKARMRTLLDLFAFNRDLVSDDLAEIRYKASIQPGFQETFSSMFPAPRQRWIESLSCNEKEIVKINKPTLVLHGREDRIIPVENSIRLSSLIQGSELHIFGKCGHWTQIEYASRFNNLINGFLS